MPAESPLTLTKAARIGRLTVKFGAVAIVVLIVGRFAITTGLTLWKAANPPPPPPPTVGFGLLPPLRFPPQSEGDKPAGYQIEVPPSRLPSFGDRARVFFIQKQSLGLFTDQKAREVAASYGFPFAPTQLSDTLYRWTKSQPLQTTLDMNAVTLDFSIKTDYLSRTELLNQPPTISDDEAVRLVKSFVSSGLPLPTDIATVSGTVRYLRSTGGELTEAIAPSDADFLEVNIRRNPVDGVRSFYSPEGTRGVLYGIVSTALSGNDRVVELSYRHQDVDYTLRHTYPLRSVQSAWQIVQAGEAYIANKGVQDTAVIRNVFLGYYEDSEAQEYMQPIYVFSGDDGFLAYVPALLPQYYQTR